MPFPLAAMVPLASTIIDAIAGLFPDNKAKAEAQAKLTDALIAYGQQQEAQQNEVNKVEAAHASVFVAGWRPAIMWVCAICILYTFLLYPWLVAVATVQYPELVGNIPPPPDDELWTLVMGVLGLGGLRTFEKHRGITNGKG